MGEIKKMKICIDLPDDYLRYLTRFTYYKKLTANLVPEHDPVDWLLLKVLSELPEYSNYILRPFKVPKP